jgi:hypothetical protein
MTNPHDPVSFPTDPRPVRPGTSDALFARTIDATPQPPLVQAQETVAALIPRVTASLSDPLLLATLAGTLVLVWLAVRMRSRLSPVLLAAMLLMTLTSFRPVQRPYADQIVDDAAAREYERPRRSERRHDPPPGPEPSPFAFRVPVHPDVLPPDLERIWEDEEFQAAIEELRLRIEAELRRRGERRYHEMRSARWIRRLPPSLQEWVVVGQQTVAAWDRGH